MIGAERRPAKRRAPAVSSPRARVESIIRQLTSIEQTGGDGILDFGSRRTLHVSSLEKLYFPDDGITKGDVMRYYAALAPALLPIVKDRPLILKRFPDGIDGPSFFQQNAGESVPKAVRTATVVTETGASAERIIGGDLLTLLYTVQIGTIAVHSWQSRVRTRQYADTTTIDLDPGDDVTFREVVTLARAIKDELDRFDLKAGVKTSGASGIHIVLPLPPKTSFDYAARVAEAVASRMARQHSRRATVERRIADRPKGTIYVDAQQNSAGKSVVAAYSVRERPKGTVSSPLDWSELRPGLRIVTFTIGTMPDRVREVGDLWGSAMKRRNSKRALDHFLRDANDGR